MHILSFLLFTARQVSSATVAELIAANPELSTANSEASKNPSWSSPAKIAVFAPTNSAVVAANLPAGSSVTLTSNDPITIANTYFLVKDTGGAYRMVFLNGNGVGQTEPGAVELRTALGTGRASNYQVADNGVLFTTDIAISPPPLISEALMALGCFKFVELIKKAGLAVYLDGLAGVTLFAPTDQGFTVDSSLTASQSRAFVLYHLVPQLIYTNNIPSRTFETMLTGNSIPIVASSAGARLPGSQSEIFSQADNFVKNGVIHRLDFTLVPPTIPGPNDAVVPVGAPAGSEPYDPAKVASTTSTPNSKPTGQKSSEITKQNSILLLLFIFAFVH